MQYSRRMGRQVVLDKHVLDLAGPNNNDVLLHIERFVSLLLPIHLVEAPSTLFGIALLSP